MRISDLKKLFTNVYTEFSILANGKRLYQFTTALSSGVTATTAPIGSIGITSHATGRNKIFISTGSYWQLLSGEAALALGLATVATTGNTDGYIHSPIAGKLAAAIFSGVDALAQHGSNYLTFSLTNLGQAGAGSAAMLAATDANTTKTTTRSALSANNPRSLTLTATGADLVVAKNDRLRFRAAATGTLANTVTFPSVLLVFEPNA